MDRVHLAIATGDRLEHAPTVARQEAEIVGSVESGEGSSRQSDEIG